MTAATDRRRMSEQVIVTVRHNYTLTPGTKYSFTVNSSFIIVPGIMSNKKDWYEEKQKCALYGPASNMVYTPKSNCTLVPTQENTADSAKLFQDLMNKLPQEIVLKVAKYFELDEGKPLDYAAWLMQLKEATSHYFAITKGLGTSAVEHFSRENALIVHSYPYADLSNEPSRLQQLAIGFQELWNRHNEEKDQPVILPPFSHYIKDIRIVIRFDKPGFNLLRCVAEADRFPLLQRVHILIDCECVRAGRYHNTVAGMPATEVEGLDFADGWKEIAATVVDGGTAEFKLKYQREGNVAATGDGQLPLFRVALSFGLCSYYPEEGDEGFEDWTELLRMIKRTVKLRQPAPGTATHAVQMLDENQEVISYGIDALSWSILEWS